jgi:hypothetical protein
VRIEPTLAGKHYSLVDATGTTVGDARAPLASRDLTVTDGAGRALLLVHPVERRRVRVVTPTGVHVGDVTALKARRFRFRFGLDGPGGPLGAVDATGARATTFTVTDAGGQAIGSLDRTRYRRFTVQRHPGLHEPLRTLVATSPLAIYVLTRDFETPTSDSGWAD